MLADNKSSLFDLSKQADEYRIMVIQSDLLKTVKFVKSFGTVPTEPSSICCSVICQEHRLNADLPFCFPALKRTIQTRLAGFRDTAPVFSAAFCSFHFFFSHERRHWRRADERSEN